MIIYLMYYWKISKLNNDHKFPPIEQRRGRKYYKFHNAYGYMTNNCVHFKNTIWNEIEQGKLNSKEKPMKVDIDSFMI